MGGKGEGIEEKRGRKGVKSVHVEGEGGRHVDDGCVWMGGWMREETAKWMGG